MHGASDGGQQVTLEGVRRQALEALRELVVDVVSRKLAGAEPLLVHYRRQERQVLAQPLDMEFLERAAHDVDGRQPGFSEGVTLVELAELLADYGVVNAINLDGGGSVSMVVGNENVVRIGRGEFNRKVSVALGVVKKYIEPVARTERAPAPAKNLYVKGGEPEYIAAPIPEETPSDSVQTLSRRDQLRAEQLRREKERQERVREEQARRREQSQPAKRKTPARTPQR